MRPASERFAVTRGPFPASGSFVTWTTISWPSLRRSSIRGPLRAALRPSDSGPVLLGVEVRGARQDVLDVEERIPLEADRDERGLHPGQHAVDAPEVDVSDEPLALLALVKHLDRAAVLRERHARLGRRGVDEELFPHAFANRRYSTARINPMPRKVVATDDPP